MIVEIMGHARHAGLVTEETWGGAPVLRIEQPGWEEGGAAGENGSAREIRLRYPPRVIRVGAGSLYRAVSCSEAEVRAALPSTTWDDSWPVEREVREVDSFSLTEWARDYLWAELEALGSDGSAWLEGVARGEGSVFRRVLEEAEQEAGRHIPAGEASAIADMARAILGEAA